MSGPVPFSQDILCLGVASLSVEKKEGKNLSSSLLLGGPTLLLSVGTGVESLFVSTVPRTSSSSACFGTEPQKPSFSKLLALLLRLNRYAVLVPHFSINFHTISSLHPVLAHLFGLRFSKTFNFHVFFITDITLVQKGNSYLNIT